MARAAVLSEPNEEWFCRSGTPLSQEDISAAKGYLAALELADCEIRAAPDAAAAEAIIRDPAWDTRWWSREEAERSRLTDLAKRQHGLRATFEALTASTEGQIEASFRRALASPGITAGREALARAAAGALSMSLHGLALARLTDAGESHVFVRKYALFALGRWPLGVAGGALHLF